MLERLLAVEIRMQGQRNVVAGKRFSETLAASILRYQNRTLDAAQVVAEIVEPARELPHEHERTAELGLAPGELAFSDDRGLVGVLLRRDNPKATPIRPPQGDGAWVSERRSPRGPIGPAAPWRVGCWHVGSCVRARAQRPGWTPLRRIAGGDP